MKKRLLAVLVSVGMATASHAQSLLIESLTGPVTQNEINSFKTYMATVATGTNNYGNEYVYGGSGTTMEACGMMYEVTGDTAILDRMIQFTDACLACRNDPTTGQIQWTGNRDPVWPNGPDNGYGYPGVSTEQGDIIGHIAYCAKLILQTPSIWSTNVAVGDPYGYGATYKDRALTYITQADLTAVNYIVPWFITAPGQGLQYWWPVNANLGLSAIKPVPWNQQMMFNNGFQRLAECHSILGDNPTRVAQYDSYVQTSINWLLSAGSSSTYSAFLKNCYTWAYVSPSNVYSSPEDNAHGQYDITGMYRAFYSGRYKLSRAQMAPFANTVSKVMTLGPNLFCTDVYASGAGTANTSNWMGGAYLLLGDFDWSIYTHLADVLIHTGGRQTGNIGVTANILWLKNAYYLGDMPSSPGWQDTDIGLFGAAGSATLASGTYTLTAQGGDIYSSADAFNYMYEAVSSTNCSIVARIDTMSTNTNTKTGVMIRETLAPESICVNLNRLTTNLIKLEYRSATGGSVTYSGSTSVVLPAWVKLTRAGNVFTGYTSTSGTSWTQFGQVTVAMATDAYMGLSQASKSATKSGTSTLDQVSVTVMPLAPTSLFATKDYCGVNLSWNSTGSATSYNVKRSTTNNGPYTTIASNVTDTGYADTGLSLNTTYYYVVSAVNASGESGNSTQASATTCGYLSSGNPRPWEAESYAFDNTQATAWYSGYDGTHQGGTGWLLAKYGSGQQWKGYVLTSAADTPECDPSSWQFQASTDGTNWTTLDTQTAQSFSARGQTKLYPTTNTTSYPYYKLNVTACTGGTNYGVQLAELRGIYPLASPWVSSVVGTVSASGTAGLSGGTYTIVGAGAGIGGTSDAFQYTYKPVTGDCSIIAKVWSLQTSNTSAKEGVMIRETLNANSTYVAMTANPSGTISSDKRDTTGGTAGGGSSFSGSLPYWVKIARVGNVFTCSYSSNGTTWTQLSSWTVTMGSSVYIGMPVTSAADGVLTTSTITNVTTTP